VAAVYVLRRWWKLSIPVGFGFSYIVFFYVHFSHSPLSLSLPISLPYTSRYDPAQEAKVQVLLSL
jgi:hypothetical protein